VATPHEQLTSKAAQWKVAIAEILETEGSLLGFGLSNGNRVVLKVSSLSDEKHSGSVLRAFQGAGTVRVFESDHGAVLLERLDPATELVELVRAGRDDEATHVLAKTIGLMANHEPPPGCPTLFDWARAFDRYISEHSNGPVSLHQVHEAAGIYRDLATTQRQTMLLHGDLHHYNVLFDSKRGWIAIDPKGVVGELEYELGAIIRNPVELPDFYVSRTVIERRLKQLTDALGLNYDRALRWTFAQAVLSAIWDVEDGFRVASDHPSLRLAELIRKSEADPPISTDYTD
jgi:streptomycin 6-kinase